MPETETAPAAADALLTYRILNEHGDEVRRETPIHFTIRPTLYSGERAEIVPTKAPAAEVVAEEPAAGSITGSEELVAAEAAEAKAAEKPARRR